MAWLEKVWNNATAAEGSHYGPEKNKLSAVSGCGFSHLKTEIVGWRRRNQSTKIAKQGERELLTELSDDVWAEIERGFAQPNTQVCFSMNEKSVPVFDDCAWQHLDFPPEILDNGTTNGVDFKDRERFMDVKDQQYLKRSPVKQDCALW